MPKAALRGCAEPGCRALVSGGGYCPTHTRARDQHRGGSTARGYGGRWKRYSLAFRTQYPLCGDRPPGAPTTSDSVCLPAALADVTDHIVPVSGPHDPRFFDPGNHQALCHRCHNRKRKRESLHSTARQRFHVESLSRYTK